MGYTLCVHVLCYRCIWATHYVYMCYVIGVYGLHTMCTCAMLLVYMGYTLCVPVLCYRCTWATHYVYMCYVIGVYGLHTMCTGAMI